MPAGARGGGGGLGRDRRPRVTNAREVHCAPFGHTAPPPPIRGGRDRFRLKEIAAQQVWDMVCCRLSKDEARDPDPRTGTGSTGCNSLASNIRLQ
ncbi:uncharacterized protein LOC143434135 isoform X2 [Arvicanthis niloticus]|uniref:uncharacterized protein LOC143308533 isoform X2 n=1 Tax=Arvicanthis niloticus TaxID=61156 RepID=UPI00402B82FE